MLFGRISKDIYIHCMSIELYLSIFCFLFLFLFFSFWNLAVK